MIDPVNLYIGEVPLGWKVSGVTAGDPDRVLHFWNTRRMDGVVVSLPLTDHEEVFNHLHGMDEAELMGLWTYILGIPVDPELSHQWSLWVVQKEVERRMENAGLGDVEEVAGW